jgi:diguanylate cyclase (GGDEF)-like protein/PAS domain S-box-containing protein
MGAHFTSIEGCALYGLLAETTDDTVIKTDRRGFIVQATPGIEELGFALPHLLFGPHLVELAVPRHAERLRAELRAALAGGERGARWIEFAAAMADQCEAWFKIRLRPLTDADGQPSGAIGVMRSIEDRRLLEQELFAAAMTDPLTGLTNRQAFLAMLTHLSGAGASASVARFSIDHFKALNLRYGQARGDELLVAFADFLRAALRSDDIISRVGNQRFAVLLPDTRPGRAESVCSRALEALAAIGGERSDDGLPITASVGIAPIASSIDVSLKHAELALFFARAKGRNRLETYGDPLLARAA